MSANPAQPPCSTRYLDALELLADRHEQTLALADECRHFARHVSADRDMQQVAEALCRSIHRLAELEEELFYPAAREALQGSTAVDIAELEHATARQIIRQMRLTDPCCACYEALVVALGDCVERHARHERVELFPLLRESCMDLVALGERISARQQELEAAH